jgi:FkbM family methyltransferase
MALSSEDRRIMADMSPTDYYEPRLLDEALWGEYELRLLHKLAKPNGTAVDVGANQGFFAYALSKVAATVEAFEPHPDYAGFARHMLGSRARVHDVALSNAPGTAEFMVPVADDGMELHLGGKLLDAKDAQALTDGAKHLSYTVQVRTLDSYNLNAVSIIKVDVEGNELQVLRGGAATIAKFRPPLIVELLTGAYDDPIAITETIATTFKYTPHLVTKDNEIVAALPVIKSLNSNTTWGSAIRNRNVLFLPKA